jgi:hypothetical protein
MLKQCLGTIEVIGLTAALEAADTACKAADVTLLGYEATDGMGMVAVKVLGQVGAVKAAIDAARFAAGKVNKVVATSVIPRPNEQIEPVVRTAVTVGQGAPTSVDPNDPGSKPASIGRFRPPASAPAAVARPAPATPAAPAAPAVVAPPVVEAPAVAKPSSKAVTLEPAPEPAPPSAPAPAPAADAPEPTKPARPPKGGSKPTKPASLKPVEPEDKPGSK